MRRSVLTALLFALGPASAQPPESSWIVADKNVPTLFRVQITNDAGDPVEAWREWQRRLLTYYDRNRDGSLDSNELARVAPFPGAAARTSAVATASARDARMKAVDANGDGKVTVEEIERYIQEGGGPLVAWYQPVTETEEAVSTALFRKLDRDGNGILAPDELHDASRLLDVHDADEDEALTPKEFLAPEFAKLKDRSDPVRLALKRGRQQEAPIAVIVHMTKHGLTARLRDAHSQMIVRTANSAKTQFEAFASFQLASWRTAIGNKTRLAVPDLPRKADLAWLAARAETLDENGDGFVTTPEVEKYLGLVQQGLDARVSVTLIDRGHNLWARLDSNHDGRLDLGELQAASQALGSSPGGWRRGDVPRQFVLLVGHGDWEAPSPLPRDDEGHRSYRRAGMVSADGQERRRPGFGSRVSRPSRLASQDRQGRGRLHQRRRGQSSKN